VDDQQELLESLTVLLEQQGAEVIACATAREAFDALAGGAAVDAAVFDISMPGEDGLTLVCRLRAWEASHSTGHLPVIALTAHVTSEMRLQCAAAGFDHYLPKPVSPVALFSSLRRLALLERQPAA